MGERCSLGRILRFTPPGSFEADEAAALVVRVDEQRDRPRQPVEKAPVVPDEREPDAEAAELERRGGDVESEREAFFLRIAGPGDYRYEGADLGILITRGRVMENDFELNDRARNWIRGIKKLYSGKPLLEAEQEQAPAAGSFKII